MEGNREIGVVINGRIRKCCLCFTYTPVSAVSEVSKFLMNSLSIVYYCAIYNLLTFRDRIPDNLSVLYYAH